MEIKIDGNIFTFSDQSEVKTESAGYDLYIQEPGYDKTTEEKIEHFTSKQILLPANVGVRVNRNSTELPCSKIYKDVNGNKRLYTYFD